MTVTGGIATTVIDQNEVAVAAVPLCHDHGTAGRRGNRRAGWCGNVEPLVEFGRAAKRVGAPAERRGDRARDRPPKSAGRVGLDFVAHDTLRAALRFELACALLNECFELRLL